MTHSVAAVMLIEVDTNVLRRAGELASTTSNGETVDLALRTLLAVRRQSAVVERIVGRRFGPDQINAPTVAPPPAPNA